MPYALCPYLALIDLSQARIPWKNPIIPVTKAKKTLTGLTFGGSAFSPLHPSEAAPDPTEQCQLPTALWEPWVSAPCPQFVMLRQSVLGCHHLDCHGKTDSSDIPDCKVTPMEITLWNNHLPLELDLLPGPTQWEQQEVVLMPHEFLIPD